MLVKKTFKNNDNNKLIFQFHSIFPYTKLHLIFCSSIHFHYILSNPTSIDNPVSHTKSISIHYITKRICSKILIGFKKKQRNNKAKKQKTKKITEIPLIMWVLIINIIVGEKKKGVKKQNKKNGGMQQQK